MAKLELLEDEIPSQVAEAADDSIEDIETLEQDLDTLASGKNILIQEAVFCFLKQSA